MNDHKNQTLKYSLIILFLLIILVGLFHLSNFNFLLFHTLVEFSIIIVMIFTFVIAWFSRQYLNSSLVFLLGTSKIFISIVEFLHTLTYKGMNIFPNYDTNLPTSLWILARYIDAITLVLVFIFYKRKVNPLGFITAYTLFTVLMIFLIFLGYFPVCYIEGKGLTLFKKISEYIISTIFLTSAYVILKSKIFAKRISILIFFHLLFLAISEIFFTFYVSVYGISNVSGHLFMFLSVSILFYVLVQEGVVDPYNLIFNELTDKKNKIELLNESHRVIYSIIKHDLRNRLTSIDGFLNLYKEEKNNFYFNKALENLDKSAIELENLTSLLTDDFLEQLYPINIKEAITKLKKQFRVEISVEGNCCALANKSIISVFYNVISNAVIHGKASKIEVKIFSNSKNCIIRILNNGSKIEDKFVNSLFKETIQKEERTSMGLMIAKKLVNLMDGDISLVSNEESNVVFEIKLKQCENENP